MNLEDHIIEINEIKSYLFEKYGDRIRAIQVELERHYYAHHISNEETIANAKGGV